MLIDKLMEKNLISPPRWMRNNVHYLTQMGSVAYGCSTDTSDVDLYGFCIPERDMIFSHLRGEINGFGSQKKRFDSWQQHHVKDGEKEYDFQIFSIVRYFHLCMENNPNCIDALFVPQNCIIHSTAIGNLMREHRREFLHKGCWPKLRGYSFSQMHKMTIKNPEPGSKRYEDVQKYGWDCYVEKDTEFLTSKGWKKFDEVTKKDMLATVKIGTNDLEFQKPLAKISKMYTGNVYVINSKMSKCSITEKHNVLVSPQHRNPGNNYSSQYKEDSSNWQLICLKDIIEKRIPLKRTHFHTLKKLSSREEEYKIEDEYLLLAGLYVAEGFMCFRNGNIRYASITQTEKGRLCKVTKLFKNIKANFPYKHYSYKKEDVWNTCKEVGIRLYKDFGHNFRDKSGAKKLPDWIFNLSHRQAKLFWDGWWLGDGTPVKKIGNVIYTSSEVLASQLHGAMCLSGHLCSVRGPYYGVATYGARNMYQIYLPHDQNKTGIVNFSNIKLEGKNNKHRNITKKFVNNCRVVCFEVPNGIIITRNYGKVSIQGNCKFGLHVVRLLLQAEQILTLGDLDLQRDREILKAIRRGEWTEKDVKDFFAAKEKDMERIYNESKLPWGPDEPKIKELLLNCLEMHYGNLDNCITIPGKYQNALQQIADICHNAGIH